MIETGWYLGVGIYEGKNTSREVFFVLIRFEVVIEKVCVYSSFYMKGSGERNLIRKSE